MLPVDSCNLSVLQLREPGDTRKPPTLWELHNPRNNSAEQQSEMSFSTHLVVFL